MGETTPTMVGRRVPIHVRNGKSNKRTAAAQRTHAQFRPAFFLFPEINKRGNRSGRSTLTQTQQQKQQKQPTRESLPNPPHSPHGTRQIPPPHTQTPSRHARRHRPPPHEHRRPLQKHMDRHHRRPPVDDGHVRQSPPARRLPLHGTERGRGKRYHRIAVGGTRRGSEEDLRRGGTSVREEGGSGGVHSKLVEGDGEDGEGECGVED
mmetsp:Transcript_23048/g.48207  ORF Transcript_23048/g.48207 Transcript_23048/m.48207 type:complete len:207 (+) Transcript_23048:502-1122(+)